MDGPLLKRALRRIGYVAVVSQNSDLASLPMPSVLRLKNGKFALATGIVGDDIVLVDGRADGASRIIPLATLALFYDGEFLEFFPSIGELERLHASETTPGHWFWSRLFKPRSRVFDVILASIMANLIAVTVSLFALQVYDRVIPNQNEATLWVLALGAAVAILFEFFLRTARAKLIDDTGRVSEIEMSRDLFRNLLGMRIDKRPAGPGALSYMVREFQGVREFFNTATVGVLADLPFVLIFLAVIYTIAGPVVWIIIAGGIAMVVPSLFYQKRMAELSREMQGGLSSASRLLTEASYGLENVKTSNAEEWLMRSWEEIIHLNATKSSEQRHLASKLTFWAGSVQQWTYISAIIAGVYLLFAGEFTTGSIIAISILTSRTLSPISQLSGVLTRWQNMLAALSAMDTVIDAEQDRSPDRVYVRRGRMSGDIALADVQATYPGQQLPTIHVQKLAIASGDRLAILGANGSGKSTLLGVLSGLHHPSQGEYLLDKVDLRQIDPADIRANIGYLPQEARLFSGTLRDNIRIRGVQFSDDDFFEALAFSGLDEMVRAHPKGLDLPIYDGGSGLSTGQKTAVGLARLFLLDPSIVILDEPTAALDQESEARFIERFDSWAGNRTCIVATHRLSILKKMSQVAIMQRGRLVIHGPRDAMLEKLQNQGAPK
jgi:ATP-binding cassette subfamily C protein LapB